jgi:uncharacterized membrane protein YphA (DoxX/SURF4 family)
LNQNSIKPDNNRSPLAGYMTHPAVTISLRCILGAIFVYAGGVKLFNMPEMASAIGNYRILPEAWLNIFGIILPPIEVVAGLCLITGFFKEGALTIITGLIIVFLIAVEAAILRGLDIDCGCFGTSDGSIVGVTTLLRDFLFLLMTIPLWMNQYYAWHSVTTPHDTAPQPEPDEAQVEQT